MGAGGLILREGWVGRTGMIRGGDLARVRWHRNGVGGLWSEILMGAMTYGLWVARVKWCGERLGWAGWGRDGMGKGRGGVGFENRLACPRNSSSTTQGGGGSFKRNLKEGRAVVMHGWRANLLMDQSLSLSPSLSLLYLSVCLSI